MASIAAFFIGLFQATFSLFGLGHPTSVAVETNVHVQPVAQQKITAPKQAPASQQSVSNRPTAAIDATSLIATNGSNPTITGTAENVSKVDLFVIVAGPTKSVNIGESGVPVINRHWSVTLSTPVSARNNIANNVYSVSVGIPNSSSPNAFQELASGTLTIKTNDDMSVSVPSMSKYTDSDFGFSFWYPTNVDIRKTQPDANSGSTRDHSDIMNGQGTVIQGIVNAPDFTAYEVYSPSMSILSAVDAGPFGSDYDKYFFDKTSHTWMYQNDGGPTGKSGGTNPADVSKNTMGGLHIFQGYTRFGLKVILPLSAHNFLVVYAKCNDATDYSCADGGTKFKTSLQTIVATDPSVATPVSAAEQIAAIQAEKQAYAGQ
jgi:hypothetical protein